jgi:hypothetical protein
MGVSVPPRKSVPAFLTGPLRQGISNAGIPKTSSNPAEQLAVGRRTVWVHVQICSEVLLVQCWLHTAPTGAGHSTKRQNREATKVEDMLVVQCLEHGDTVNSVYDLRSELMTSSDVVTVYLCISLQIRCDHCATIVWFLRVVPKDCAAPVGRRID